MLKVKHGVFFVIDVVEKAPKHQHIVKDSFHISASAGHNVHMNVMQENHCRVTGRGITSLCLGNQYDSDFFMSHF